MRAYFGGGKTMKILKIALLQIAPCDTLQENMEILQNSKREWR